MTHHRPQYLHAVPPRCGNNSALLGVPALEPRSATEVALRLAEVETDVQGLVEAHMETLLGVRFLASEYSTGPVHGGRVDSLGLDENGAPVVVEYKRGVDSGVINQGLFYLSWLMDHRAEFEHLVRDRLGRSAAAGCCGAVLD
jgi:RecB family endonuclease NucS